MNTITNVWNSNASYPSCSDCTKPASCYYSFGYEAGYYACEEHDPTLAANWPQLRRAVPYFTYSRNVLPQITFSQPGTTLQYSSGGWLPAGTVTTTNTGSAEPVDG